MFNDELISTVSGYYESVQNIFDFEEEDICTSLISK